MMELFVYSSCIECSCCRDRERVVGLVSLDAALSTHITHSLCQLVLSYGNCTIPAIGTRILERLQVECTRRRIRRAKASIFLEQTNETPVRVFGVQVMINL